MYKKWNSKHEKGFWGTCESSCGLPGTPALSIYVCILIPSSYASQAPYPLPVSTVCTAKTYPTPHANPARNSDKTIGSIPSIWVPVLRSIFREEAADEVVVGPAGSPVEEGFDVEVDVGGGAL